MDLDINRIQAHVLSRASIKSGQNNSPKVKSDEFKNLMDNAKSKSGQIDVTISAHASKRLMERSVTLDRIDLEKINYAMDQAAEKGAKESLFVLRDLALLVSVENRTVITAMHGDSAKDNVFTQIDSAVLL